MTTYQATYTDRIRQEVAQTPDEYLPLLLEMIHTSDVKATAQRTPSRL